MTDAEEFMRLVRVDGHTRCWAWAGPTWGKGGEPVFWWSRPDDPDSVSPVPPQVWAFERFRRPLPIGYRLALVCGDEACLNPAHMVTVSKETALMLDEGRCPKGHPYRVEELLAAGEDGLCRACSPGDSAWRLPRPPEVH